jgi:hypothetical protein
MQWLQTNAFASPTWLVNLKTLKNTDYSGYTERFRNLQARHLDDILSFDRLGRLWMLKFQELLTILLLTY